MGYLKKVYCDLDHVETCGFLHGVQHVSNYIQWGTNQPQWPIIFNANALEFSLNNAFNNFLKRYELELG